jgi:hypothetical protein
MESYIRIGFILSVLLILSACESSFDPLAENDQLIFTMNGFLDVHADTQWVRAMPIGESLNPTDPDPNGSVLNLSNLSTGEIYMLKDSLFKFGGDTYVWNYWLSEDIRGDELYEIVAEAPDGGQSQVVVATPSPLPEPNVTYSKNFESIGVSGIALDSIIVAETRYLAQALTSAGCAPEREIVISHLDEMILTDESKYTIHSDNREKVAKKLGVAAFNFRVNRREFVLVTAGPDWPKDVGLSDIERSLPEVRSNVEGGTGLVAGIARRKVEISERIPPCEG